MLLEALEVLQSAGETGTYVTDFALYKVVSILATYCPLLLATFLLSQEYLGEKIACFAPDNFTDGQAGALSEYCWNNGYWSNIDSGATTLRNQPHRFFAFYLAIQAVVCMTPTIIWNVMTKSRLLATLKGTEEFLEDLVEAVEEGPEDDSVPSLEALEEKVKGQLRQFHNICLTTARSSKLSHVLLLRQVFEMTLYFLFTILQSFIIESGEDKRFICTVHELHPDPVKCTVPVLDLLGFMWGFNTVTLILSLIIIVFFFQGELRAYHGIYLPLFFSALPYGDEDNFYKEIKWDSNGTKHSYELLTMLFEESSTIMTKVYVLNAMKPNIQMAPSSDHSTATSEDERFEEVRKALKKRSRFRMT